MIQNLTPHHTSPIHQFLRLIVLTSSYHLNITINLCLVSCVNSVLYDYKRLEGNYKHRIYLAWAQYLIDQQPKTHAFMRNFDKQ